MKENELCHATHLHCCERRDVTGTCTHVIIHIGGINLVLLMHVMILVKDAHMDYILSALSTFAVLHFKNFKVHVKVQYINIETDIYRGLICLKLWQA